MKKRSRQAPVEHSKHESDDDSEEDDKDGTSDSSNEEERVDAKKVPAKNPATAIPLTVKTRGRKPGPKTVARRAVLNAAAGALEGLAVNDSRPHREPDKRVSRVQMALADIVVLFQPHQQLIPRHEFFKWKKMPSTLPNVVLHLK